MNVYDEIVNTTFNAIECLIRNRIKVSAFTDQEDVHERQYFSTLEGLDAILIPLVNLPKNFLWQPLVSKYPELINIIIDDLNFIIGMNLEREQPPEEHGMPYFTEKRGTRQDPYWTTECSSFTLSVLINYLKLEEKYNLKRPKIPKTRALDVIRLNVDWVSKCRRNSDGWSWTFKTDAHPWPTWSLLDSFEELLSLPKYQHQYRYLQQQCDSITSTIIKSFLDTTEESYLTQWRKKVLQPTVEGKQFDINVALDLSRLILATCLYKSGQEVFPLVQSLYCWITSIKDFGQTEYCYRLIEPSDTSYDSSLLPSLLRTLIVSSHSLRPKLVSNLDENIGGDHQLAINKVYSALQQDLITGHQDYKGLWGVRHKGQPKYELYYTERILEALSDFLVYYKPTDKLLIEPALRLPERPKLAKKTKVAKKKKLAAKKTSEVRAIPNDISLYTIWIPQLAQRKKPNELTDVQWTTEDLMEFYLYRLFTQTLFLDGTEWGRKKRGKDLPDGRFTVPVRFSHLLCGEKPIGNRFN